MKISELRKALLRIQENEGDIEVLYHVSLAVSGKVAW